MREDDDLKRATELSLQGREVLNTCDSCQDSLNACSLYRTRNLLSILVLLEFNNSLPDLLCSDDDSGNEDALEMDYSEAEAEVLKRNAEVFANSPS